VIARAPPFPPFQDAVRDHYDARDSEPARRTRPDDPLARVRRYNNYVKAAALARACAATGAAAARVLDVGCGRGGDVQKYARLGVASVDGLDVSPSSILEARRRAGDSACRFRVADLRDPMQIRALGASGPYDVVVLFFSLQYLVATRDAATRLFCAVARASSGAARCVVAAPRESAVLGVCGPLAPRATGELARVVPIASSAWTDAEPFGRQYDFCLAGAIDRCPEYVVPTAELLQVLGETGWRVVRRASFADLEIADADLARAMRAPALRDLDVAERGVVELYDLWELERVAA